MVTQIIGNYLIDKNLLTREQLHDLVAEQQIVRVRLGLIAVLEGLMTQEEADKVNKLQAIKDMRFGDIAVEKGYLTARQVEDLLKIQANGYLSFAQVLENNQLMTIEQLEHYMNDYATENDLTVYDLEDFKSDDVERILPHFLSNVKDNRYLDLAGVAVRMIIRCVNQNVYPKKAYFVSELKADNGAVQHVTGDKVFSTGFAGRGDELLAMAGLFGEEDFEVIDEDTLDAVGELINCINGVYATALSQDGVILELMPPEYFVQIHGMKGTAENGQFLILPLMIKEKEVRLVLTMDQQIGIE